MVANVAQAFSANYYLHKQRSFRHPNEYLDAGQEPDGVWFNPNQLLGLSDSANIDSMHFYRLYDGYHPETRQGLTQNAGSANRSPGLDIEFSADKSVSALWAIADKPLRTKIEEAHNAAARTALQEIFLKECSYTRARVGGAQGAIHILPAHMLGAIFQHSTSRADDPQLHTHFLMFNAVQTESDGKWRALHQKPLYKAFQTGGACYRAHLASNLTERGIEMERYGKDNTYVRVKHIPKELEKLWSKRHLHIADAAARRASNPADNSKRSHMVPIEARHRKHRDSHLEHRHIRWRQECAELFDPTTLIDIFRVRLHPRRGS